MRISDTLKKAAGLFVEFDETGQPVQSMSDADFQKAMSAPLPSGSATAPAPAAKTIEQLVREAPGPNLDQIKVPAPAVEPLGPDGKVDFNAIYAMANVGGSPFTAEQLLELLATLPAELPLESRRQAVKITIQAMAKTVNVTPEMIVTDASRKLAALAAYAEAHSKQVAAFVSNSESEIQALQAQIEGKQKAIEDAKQQQDAMVHGCTAESDRLDDVLEFFSLDVPPSKYAKPGTA